MKEQIINRVASSKLVTIDLQEFIPEGERVAYDLKDNLYEGLILREKDFRAFARENDWSQYQGKHVAVHCSEDAIVPKWAFMLLATKLTPYVASVFFGTLQQLEDALLLKAINDIKPSNYEGAKVVIKGCGDKSISESAYMEITALLQPVAASIMYGEPCSTVPIYKKARK